MRSIILYAASILHAVSLAFAAPMTSDPTDVTIKISTGDGDSARTLLANIGTTTLATSTNNKSVKSSLSRANTWSGGFRDEAATDLWLNFDGTDGIFSTANDAHYSRTSDGGTASKVKDAINVASYWCADSLAAVLKRVEKRSLPGAEPPAQESARLTLEIEAGTTFIQREIPINGQLTPLDISLVSIAFTHPIAGVSCQAFNGDTPVGNAVEGDGEAVLGAEAVWISGTTCSKDG